MAITFFVLILLGVAFFVWYITKSDEVDDIIRERIDYDVWLRRHNLTEEKRNGKE